MSKEMRKLGFVVRSHFKTRAEKDARAANAKAVSSLTRSFETNDLLDVLTAGITKDYPNGLAYKMWEKLHKKFMPSDIVTNVELITRLMGVMITDEEHPDKLFSEILKTEVQFASKDFKIPVEMIQARSPTAE